MSAARKSFGSLTIAPAPVPFRDIPAAAPLVAALSKMPQIGGTNALNLR
jgi:hypothetical protein